MTRQLSSYKRKSDEADLDKEKLLEAIRSAIEQRETLPEWRGIPVYLDEKTGRIWTGVACGREACAEQPTERLLSWINGPGAPYEIEEAGEPEILDHILRDYYGEPEGAAVEYWAAYGLINGQLDAYSPALGAGHTPAEAIEDARHWMGEYWNPTELRAVEIIRLTYDRFKVHRAADNLERGGFCSVRRVSYWWGRLLAQPPLRQQQKGTYMTNNNHANRFLDLAYSGAQGTASSGERVANRVARALEEIGDDMALLDCQAIEALCEVLRTMAGPWQSQQQKDVIFQGVERAASGRRR